MQVSARNTLWILVFFGFWVNYMLRNNINIAIVAMVKPENSNFTIFNWDEYEIGLILSSYFWFHWITELPGGILAHRYGTKVVFGTANLLGAITTLLLPVIAKHSFNGLIALRVFQGFVGGTAWPSMHAMVAKWIPPKDRATFLSSYLGSSVGIAYTYASSGYMIEWYGWESIFYIQGVLAMIWWIAWIYLVYESPSVHPWISSEERKYIDDNIGDTLIKERLPIPWKDIMLSKPVWINMSTQFGAVWGLYAMITLAPTYLKFIHDIHIRNTGVITGLPHICRWIFAYMFGKFSQVQNCFSISGIRKLATALCTIGVGIFLLIMAYSDASSCLAVACMIIAITLQGTIPAGPMASLIDLSPNFSSVLQGISGTISVLSGFMGPLLIGYLTKGNQTYHQWRKFFWISSFVCCSCGFLDVFCSSSELQSWNMSNGKFGKEANLLEEGKSREEKR